MKGKKYFLFVVEGATRELGIFNNIKSVFFNDKSDVITIPVPAEMNIYMLYKILKKDNFEIDIVELLKEKVPKARKILEGYTRSSFAEVYFFFDFDEHSNNLHNKSNIEALSEMLEVFDNETELGKLYISYPMVEAIRDFNYSDCGTANGDCFRARSDFGTYKNDSGQIKSNNDISDYDFSNWKAMIANFIHRASCFFRINHINRQDFIELVNPLSVFRKEIEFYSKIEKIFILSCFPEFLIDYSENYWNAAIGKRKKPIIRKGCDQLNGGTNE